MQQLFDNLMALCNVVDSPFSFKDHRRLDQTFRIFNYRLASYTDFCKPGALEARGITFLMENDQPVRIVCRPPEKFFNWQENPFTMNLQIGNLISYMKKEDGSLISSYFYTKDKLGLKSKASLASEQAVWAEEYLQRPENQKFYEDVYDLTIQGYTVNMEFVSPRNQVVVPYSKDELVVLNVRNNETGITLFKDQVFNKKNLNWVEEYFPSTISFLNIAQMKGIEGFVMKFHPNNQLVKIKTDAYLALHKTKDSITIPRRLFECVINEATDDLRALFKDDPISLQRITDMENMVRPRYNHMVATVESYYKFNKDLIRKDYAIKGQKELGPFFGLGMNLYLGKEPYYKEFAIKNYKTFGVPDVDETKENE